MNGRRVVVLAVLGALAFNAHHAKAAEVDVSVAGFSQHTKPGFNGVNPGLGVRVANGALAWELGEYKNSYRRTSAYAIAEYTPVHIGDASAGVFAGVASGYTAQEDGVRPFVGGFSVRYQPGRFGVALKIVPPAGPGSAGFVAVEFLVIKIKCTAWGLVNAVSALEVLRGGALQGRKIDADAIIAVIDGLCAGAEARQVADRRGGTFTIERI